MYYYNPSTKETLQREELKHRLNHSFPHHCEEIQGWFLVHQGAVPQGNGIPVKENIACIDGKWTQLYSLKSVETDSLMSDDEANSTLEERVSNIETALMELASAIVALESMIRKREKANG